MRSKSIDILKTLSKVECKAFRDFVSSPFHNKNRNLVKLYDELRKFYPDFDDRNLTNEKIHTKIFGKGKPYNDSVMKNLLSELYKILCSYFLQIGIARNDYYAKEQMIREMILRRLFKISAAEYKKLDEEIESGRRTDEKYYLMKYLMKALDMNLQFELSPKAFFADDMLEKYNKEEEHYLVNYFFSELQRTYATTFDWSIELNRTPDFKFFDIYLSALETGISQKIFDHAITAGYYHLKLILSRFEDEDSYRHLKHYVMRYRQEKFGLFELRVWCEALSSFCYFARKKGQEGFMKEEFDILKIMVENDYFSQSGQDFLPPANFRTDFTLSINAGEFEWTEDFFNTYIKRVAPEFRESLTYYYNAIKLNAIGDYACALGNLNAAKFPDAQGRLYTKIMTMMVYYELKNYEGILDITDSYRHFMLNNPNLPEHLKEDIKLFVKFLNSLVRIKFKAEGFSSDADFLADNLHKQITEAPGFRYRFWLLKKCDELIKELNKS